MSELTEGIEVLSEKRNMTMGQLTKDYAAIIDKQREEIRGLHAELEYYRGFAEQLGAKKAVSEKEQWEACADGLIDYAHEFVHQLSLWGKGYDRNDRQIKHAEDAIEEYLKLKNKNTQ
jgi:hypothetical protein